MSDTDEMTCALWYWSHGSVGYTLYEDEDAAVHGAVWMAEDGYHAYPAGIQYSDGTYTPIDDWAAYEAEQARLTVAARCRVAAAAAKPRPATREIRPPFDTEYDHPVSATAGAPRWLGRQPGPAPLGPDQNRD